MTHSIHAAAAALLLSTLSFGALALTPAAVELTDLPGVKATAISCYLQSDCSAPGAFSAMNAIDNVAYAYPGTGAWNAGTYAGASGNWLRIDFGAVYDFQRIQIDGPVNSISTWRGYSNRFVLSTSVDGMSWTAAGGGAWIDVPGNTALSSAVFNFAPGAQPFGRFLEYRVLGAVAGTNEHWSGVSEINALGNLHVSAVPEPVSWALLLLGLGVIAAKRSVQRARQAVR